MNLPAALSESEALADFKQMMSANQLFRSHIGAGYYPNFTPAVILRNILENPGQSTLPTCVRGTSSRPRDTKQANERRCKGCASCS